MNWRVALRLGRVSNLPTVWTNVLVGVVLAGGAGVDAATIIVCLAAMSLMYVAGMFLNDAFDREIDAVERPERPIPSGQVTFGQVATAGWAMMLAGIGLIAVVTHGLPGAVGGYGALGAIGLAGAIVFYDLHHKKNPVSPFVMGVCRMLVYVTAGLAVSATVPGALFMAAVVALGYLIGLTYAAKQENLAQFTGAWPLVFLAAPFVYLAPDLLHSTLGLILLCAFLAWVLYAVSFLLIRARLNVPRAVISLIAGISLLDACLIATTGNALLAVAAVIAFGVTLALQRFVPGT